MATVMILIVLGAVLLLLETILPGLVAGIFGVASLIAAVVMGYVNFGARTGNMILLGILVGLVIGTYFWIRYFPTSRVARLFISERQVGELGVEKPELLGQTGTAFTQLRPAGTALIQGRRVDVVTEGDLIERGTPIKVVAVEGMRVVVRAI